MKNLAENIMDLWTLQELSKQVRNISISWHPDNSDLVTGHCFTNGMVADRKMLLLESRFGHIDTLDHRIIIYIMLAGPSTCMPNKQSL